MSTAVALFMQKPTWDLMKDQAAVLFKSGLLPSSITKVEAAIAIIIKGYELGIPPMQAFAHISIVNGRPTISAELMLALIYQRMPYAVISFKKIASDGCVILAARSKDHALTEFTFTIENAENAKLTGKDNWKNYPKAMCKARTIADMARTIFPDVLMGCSYTREELSPDDPFIDIEAMESKPADSNSEKESLIQEIELLVTLVQDETIRQTILETLEKGSASDIDWFKDVRERVQGVIEKQKSNDSETK